MAEKIVIEIKDDSPSAPQARPQAVGPPQSTLNAIPASKIATPTGTAARDASPPMAAMPAGSTSDQLSQLAKAMPNASKAAGSLGKASQFMDILGGAGFGNAAASAGAASGAAGGAAGAAGAAGLAGGAAAALGPLAMVPAAAEKAFQGKSLGLEMLGLEALDPGTFLPRLLKGGAQVMGKAADVAGEVGTQAIRGDNAQAVGSAVMRVHEAGTEMLRNIPVIGDALGDLGESTRKVIGVFGDLINAATAEGKRLSQYDAGLAMAGAGNEIRDLKRDIREADKFGPELSRMMEAQNRINDQVARALEPIKKWLYDKGAMIAEAINDGISVLRELFVWIAATYDNFRPFMENLLRGNFREAQKVAEETGERIREEIEKLRKEETEPVPWDKFFADLEKIPGAANFGNNPGIPDQRPNMPILNLPR